MSSKTGVYVLEKGEEALIGRAWLTQHAEQSINVQYFIWSTDNIGILATEAILQAGEEAGSLGVDQVDRRGVLVEFETADAHDPSGVSAP